MNKKKIILSIIVFVAVFALATVLKTKAAALPTDNVKGWLWGGMDDGSGNTSGLGWISANNINPGAGGAIPYGIKIPAGAGDIGGTNDGYMWSENVGEIDFSPHDGCPGSPKYAGACDAYPAAPNSDAYRVKADDTELDGWARFVEIAKASVAGNSGGWKGWIKLKGPGYAVSIDSETGEMSGYAWSDELGWISFRDDSPVPYGATMAPKPAITVSGGGLINVRTAVFPYNTNISYNVTNAADANLSSCTVTTSGLTPAGSIWNPAIYNYTSPVAATVTESFSFSIAAAINAKYEVACTGDGGENKESTTLATVCYPMTCQSRACDENTSLPVYGVINATSCDATSTCSNDAECETKTPGEWKEVTP